jgi:hypothetical protein
LNSQRVDFPAADAPEITNGVTAPMMSALRIRVTRIWPQDDRQVTSKAASAI